MFCVVVAYFAIVCVTHLDGLWFFVFKSKSITFGAYRTGHHVYKHFGHVDTLRPGVRTRNIWIGKLV
jgi:hypothetical protein